MSRVAPMIIAAALGGLVVGGIVWFARPAPPAVAQAPANTTQMPDASITTPANTASPAPWADSSTAPTGADLGPAIRSVSTDPKKKMAREAIRAKILSLTANGRQPTPAEMNAVLGELERVEGSSVISGVNVGALRNNLSKVDEMQRLGLEMKNESTKPNGGDPKKLKELMERLQKLQTEMRTDIAAPAAPTMTQK
jgi:hypothetical protein